MPLRVCYWFAVAYGEEDDGVDQEADPVPIHSHRAYKNPLVLRDFSLTSSSLSLSVTLLSLPTFPKSALFPLSPELYGAGHSIREILTGLARHEAPARDTGSCSRAAAEP